jgi:uncharacterized protein (TIGR03083 family)
MTPVESLSIAGAQQRLSQEWSALESALAGLSEAQMLEAAVVGDWSVKDLLGHIAFWAQEAAKNTELVKDGRQGQITRPGGPEDTDRWNTREQRLRAGRSLAEVRRELAESHRLALAALADLPEETLGLNLDGGTFLELYAVDTYDHYREHTDHILAWRKRLENT